MLGVGAPEPRWRRGRGRGTASSRPFFSKRRGGGGGVPQPRSCDSLEARAAGVSASPGPLQNAARRARRCHSRRRRRLSSSRRARESGGSCGADNRAATGRARALPAFADAPFRSRPASRAPAPRQSPQAPPQQEPLNFSPQATAYSSITVSAASRRRKGRRGLLEPSFLLLTSPLSSRNTRTPERTKWLVEGQRSRRC